MVISVVSAGAVCGGAGLVVGAFMPAVGRKIKALFVKETSAAKSTVSKAVASAASSIEKKL